MNALIGNARDRMMAALPAGALVALAACGRTGLEVSDRREAAEAGVRDGGNRAESSVDAGPDAAKDSACAPASNMNLRPDPRWVLENPSPQANALNAVWAAGESDLWAFGDMGTAMHWDGTAWTVHESMTGGPLRGAWGSRSDDVWAVGAAGTILHWNGLRWSAASVGCGDFTDVWGSAANDVWAVGSDVYHWDGTAWNEDPTAPSNLRRIQGSSRDRVWAMDDSHGFWRRDGRTWLNAEVPLPAECGSSKSPECIVAADLAAGPDAVWILQVYLPPTRFTPNARLLRWNGAEFTPHGVNARGALTKLAIVGRVPFLLDGFQAYRFDGSNLRALPGPDPYYASYVSALFGLAEDKVWTVGRRGEVARWDGSVWTDITGGPRNRLRGVTRAGPMKLAFGDRESPALSWTGTSWRPMSGLSVEPGYSGEVMGMWGTSPENVWAASAGALYKWDGSAWTARVRGELFSGVWGTAPDDFWIIGATSPSGTAWVRHGDGSTFTSVSDVKFSMSYDIDGSARDDVWILGRFGSSYHFDGRSWQSFPVPVGATRAVSVHGPRDAWAVGAHVMAHWDGQSWSVHDPGVSASWEDIHVVADNDVWAVSADPPGAWHFDGRSWQKELLPARVPLFGVWVDGSSIWLVGSSGVILHRQTP